MCEFCSNVGNIIDQNYEDSGYNHLDSATYFLYGGNIMHISPQYISAAGCFGERKHSIFNIPIRFCPFCGKPLVDGNDFKNKYKML